MKVLNIALCMLASVCLMGCRNAGSPSGSAEPETIVAESTVETVTEGSDDDRGYAVKVGDQAPDFTIEYLDGRSEKLSDLQGKLVMIQFTASWCGVCRKEMPYIERDIWQKYKKHPGFALIGIDLKENKETTAKFAETMQVTYPLTLDLDGSRFGLYTEPGAGVTRNILVDKEGKIVLLTRLFEMEEFNEMVEFIDHYLSANF